MLCVMCVCCVHIVCMMCVCCVWMLCACDMCVCDTMYHVLCVWYEYGVGGIYVVYAWCVVYVMYVYCVCVCV